MIRTISADDDDLAGVLVAEVDGEVIGRASYRRRDGGSSDADVAVRVDDRWRRFGIGQRLVRRLAELARSRGVEALTAGVVAGDREAVELLRGLPGGHAVAFRNGEVVVRAVLVPSTVGERPFAPCDLRHEVGNPANAL